MSRKPVTRVMTGVILGSALLIASAANAQQGGMERGHDGGMMWRGTGGHEGHAGMEHGQTMAGKHRGAHGFFLAMREELELTDAQVARLRELRTETQKQMVRARARLEVARIELHELLTSEDVDRNRVDAKIDEIGRLQTEMHVVVQPNSDFSGV